MCIFVIKREDDAKPTTAGLQTDLTLCGFRDYITIIQYTDVKISSQISCQEFPVV